MMKHSNGLKEAALFAYDNIVNILEPYGYYPVHNTQGIWAHKTKSIRFCLCVDVLALNISERRTQNILLMLYAPITKQQLIGQAKIIVVSTLNGTT